MQNKRPLPLKIDDIESLERLINESYQEIYDEQTDLQDKINDINKVGDDENTSLFIQQFGEVYTRIIEAKGKVSDRKLKLIQVLKEIYKLNESEKKNDKSSSMSNEEIQLIMDKIENLKS